jgi:hypothetical protein
MIQYNRRTNQYQGKVKYIVVTHAFPVDIIERRTAGADQGFFYRKKDTAFEVKYPMHKIVRDKMDEPDAMGIGFLAAVGAEFIGDF